MSNIEDKLTKLDKEKADAGSSVIHVRKSRVRLIKWGLIVGLFILTTLISLYFISPYRLIDTITVSGSEEVYDQVVLDSSGVESGDSVIENYLNRGKIEEKIVAENPQVSQAELSIAGIQDIVILIEEYQTVAYLSNENSYDKILENGEILEESVPRINDNQPILSEFEEGKALNALIDEYDNLEDDVQGKISEIDYLENERNEMLVRVFMNDGNEVLISIPSFSERLNYYDQMKEAVNDTKGIFDLEAGAYFIPFTSEEETEVLEEFE